MLDAIARLLIAGEVGRNIRRLDGRRGKSTPRVGAIDGAPKGYGKMVLSLGVLLTVVASFGCSSPTTPELPDYAGVWQGQVRVTRCLASEPRLCDRNFPTGMVAALRLELHQARDRVTGTVRLALPTAVPETGDVVGRVSRSGELALDGTLFRASGTGLIESGRLERSSTRTGPTGNELMGSFVERSFSFGTIQLELEWTLVEVTRVQEAI